MDNFAFFIISTGRCGTQWLAQQLKQQLPAARVEHEPLAYDYDPINNSPTSPLISNNGLSQRG